MNTWMVAIIIIIMLFLLYYVNEYYNKYMVDKPIDIDPSMFTDISNDISDKYNQSINIIKEDAEKKRQSRNFIKDYFMSYNENILQYNPDEFWDYIINTIKIGLDEYINENNIDINLLNKNGKCIIDKNETTEINNNIIDKITDKIIINNEPIYYDIDDMNKIVISYSGLHNIVENNYHENIDRNMYDSLQKFIQISPRKIDEKLTIEHIAYICYEEIQKQLSKDKKIHKVIYYGNMQDNYYELKNAYIKIQQYIYNATINEMSILFPRKKLIAITNEMKKKFQL